MGGMFSLVYQVFQGLWPRVLLLAIFIDAARCLYLGAYSDALLRTVLAEILEHSFKTHEYIKSGIMSQRVGDILDKHHDLADGHNGMKAKSDPP